VIAPRRARRRRLHLTSVAGIPLGIGLILVGQVIEGGSLQSLLQTTAAFVVFGGTLAAVLVSYSPRQVLAATRSLGRVFVDDRQTPAQAVAAILHYARLARRAGMIGLEEYLPQESDPFLRKGLGLAVDGMNAHLLRDMLEGESLSEEERDEMPARVFESAGGYAPTMGILGAVLGLIHVMGNLGDPTKLGQGIAIAFVATIYGVAAANLVLLPIGTRFRLRARADARRRELMLEGILAIQEGMNPRIIEQKLWGLTGEPADRVRLETSQAA
jgi:chemotaxis protein MotA